MGAFSLDFTPVARDFGRSGYNKDDTTKGDKGRSGYNKGPGGDDDDEQSNGLCDFGRSGYNKGDGDDKPKNGGRSGYN